MANTKSALKRIRSNERKHKRNRIVVSRTRTALTAARSSIGEGELSAATEATRLAIKQLDKAAEKGIIHRNSAARRKSRLMKALNALKAESTK